MNTERLEKELKDIIIKYSKSRIGYGNINDDSEIINDFGYDSVSTIKLVIDIEKQFGIEIDDENLSMDKIGKYKTLKKIIVEKTSI